MVIRLNEELSNNPEKATFWTLTISNEEYEKLKSDSKKKDKDSVCKLAAKRMLKFNSSLRRNRNIATSLPTHTWLPSLATSTM